MNRFEPKPKPQARAVHYVADAGARILTLACGRRGTMTGPNTLATAAGELLVTGIAAECTCQRCRTRGGLGA